MKSHDCVEMYENYMWTREFTKMIIMIHWIDCFSITHIYYTFFFIPFILLFSVFFRFRTIHLFLNSFYWYRFAVCFASFADNINMLCDLLVENFSQFYFLFLFFLCSISLESNHGSWAIITFIMRHLLWFSFLFLWL